jgi:hypothetical protein
MLLLGLVPAPLLAAETPAAGNGPGWHTAPAAVSTWENLKTQFLNFLFTTLRSRERMIQVAAIGVGLGLYIMLRR